MSCDPETETTRPILWLSCCMVFTQGKAGSYGLFERLDRLMHRRARHRRLVDVGGGLRADHVQAAQRKFDDRPGALAELALEAEGAAMQLDEAARQRQTEAGALIAAVEAAFRLSERLQHAHQVIGPDADAGIANRQLAAAVLDDPPAHVDRAARKREFHCIREQIDDDLLHLPL